MESIKIAGYCRISFDEELDKTNVSIENQKAMISAYVSEKFPNAALDLYVDRDRSGYTFEQREQYQALRKKIINHEYDALVVKDFSRFSRRNSRGLVELEDLRDAGARIISIGDNVDYPNDDDWLKIQFQFLINEMPVTDTSKKIKAVIQRRQEDANWICSAPYGYVINNKKEFEIVPDEAEVVKIIFQLYVDGYGYKKIAKYLSEKNIPTPREKQRERIEARGQECKIKVSTMWAIVVIQKMITNDFYIGTLRTHKYTRAKINGKDVKTPDDEHIVFPNHHPAIIDKSTFELVQELHKRRTTKNYRGTKKYDNVYTGFLVCGDCGSAMYTMSRATGVEAYHCGMYHKYGKKCCTSHFIKSSTLDEIVKKYIQVIVDGSQDMFGRLEKEIATKKSDADNDQNIVLKLKQRLEKYNEEIKVYKRQKIRDIMANPDNEDVISQAYDEIDKEMLHKISGTEEQLRLMLNKQTVMTEAKQKVQTVSEVFNAILEKPALDKKDIALIIDHILIYEDHIEIKLLSDVESIISCSGNKNYTLNDVIRSIELGKNKEKRTSVNVVSEGDPLDNSLIANIFVISLKNVYERIQAAVYGNMAV